MKEKILIVDDEPDILKTLESILRGEEFRVKSAHDGREAISVFKSESFDLVITDMKMPGMKGTEVVREIKQLDEDMEVIILTGFASIDSAIKAGVLFAEQDDNMIEYYPTNPGHSKKRFANPKRIEYRKRYGWPVPNVT